jgi:hypothetical protein
MGLYRHRPQRRKLEAAQCRTPAAKPRARQPAPTAYDKSVAETPFEDIMYTSLRSPSTLEVAERGLVGSTVVIALWFFGRGVRRRLRRKGAPYRQDAEPWLWINGDGVRSACHLQMQFVYVIANVARLFIR